MGVPNKINKMLESLSKLIWEKEDEWAGCNDEDTGDMINIESKFGHFVRNVPNSPSNDSET